MSLNSNLFYWIFIGCILSVISLEIPRSIVDETTKECLDKLGYDEKKLMTMFDEKFHVIYPHEVTTNVMECYLGKVHMFKENGEHNRDVIIENLVKFIPQFLKDKINEEKATGISKKLYNTCTGENSVQKIAIMHNCVMDNLERVATS
ncbi:hypothetical protein RI129_009705 [Pyrocoelia pectoralis]|uniref:Uncharacterized protein n=1 Tax=Pyrocoelia pectoralis TaxID=417401 RepID=A0AAN7V6L8_9COLE